jgi:DNA helicase-2/ATP-dependent DNA helicase PcrA
MRKIKGDREMFTPSKYQQDIYNFVSESLSSPEKRRNLIISAVAGSGKSTTIKELLRYIPSNLSVLYLTFMREVNLDLGSKVDAMKQELNGTCPKAEVRTCHSIGNGCLRSIGIKGDPGKNGRKYNRLCQTWLRSHMETYNYKVSEQLAKLVDKVRVTLADTNEDSYLAILDRYDIDLDPSDNEVWPLVLKAVPEILEGGILLAKEQIDFTDQIWLPSSKAMNLQPDRYDVVMIDEAQDLSPVLRELALKAAKKDGMVISVGDRRQAIMAFAGASANSLDELKIATCAAELPLNKNYRCPESVIRKARELVPEIEAWEGAEEGEVNYIHNGQIADLAQTGDMILCRWNAPLVQTAIELIRMRKRCIVKGKDLGGDVTGFLDRIGKFYQDQDRFFYPDMMFTDLYKSVHQYQSTMLAILQQDEEQNEGKINKLDDNTNTLLALYDGYQEEIIEPSNSLLTQANKGNYEGFKTFIQTFFSEHGEAKGEVKAEARRYTITLSTGHKAKGLENPNVFIIGYDELPSNKAKTAEAKEQEQNLLYVMITRPQKSLFLAVKDVELYTASEEIEEMPEVEEIISVAEVSQPAQIAVVEAPQMPVAPIVEETPVSTAKRGRKAKNEGEKVVKTDVRFDPSIRAALDALMEELKEADEETIAARVPDSAHKKPSLSDVLTAALLQYEPFQEKFYGKYEDEFYARKDKKAHADDEKGPDDDGPGGGTNNQPGDGFEDLEPGVSNTLEMVHDTSYGTTSLFPNIQTEAPRQIRRVFYHCLRPRCKRDWAVDYYLTSDGQMYRTTDDGQVIYAENDFLACPYCSNERRFIKKTIMKRQHSSKRKCDSRCYNARPGSPCTCQCGGVNHATGHDSSHSFEFIGTPLLQLVADQNDGE